MTTKELIIINPSGLHARPAAEFAKTAAKFKSDITLKKGTSAAVNAKSLIMILSLSINCGESVEICANGIDETEALEALCAVGAKVE